MSQRTGQAVPRDVLEFIQGSLLAEAGEKIAATSVTRICNYCFSTVGNSQVVLSCEHCGATHHLGCWQANNSSCSTYGCSSHSARPAGEIR